MPNFFLSSRRRTSLLMSYHSLANPSSGAAVPDKQVSRSQPPLASFNSQGVVSQYLQLSFSSPRCARMVTGQAWEGRRPAPCPEVELLESPKGGQKMVLGQDVSDRALGRHRTLSKGPRCIQDVRVDALGPATASSLPKISSDRQSVPKERGGTPGAEQQASIRQHCHVRCMKHMRISTCPGGKHSLGTARRSHNLRTAAYRLYTATLPVKLAVVDARDSPGWKRDGFTLAHRSNVRLKFAPLDGDLNPSALKVKLLKLC